MQLKKRIREYFSFTLKERIGIVVLIVLVFVVFILPGLIRANKRLPDNEAKEISEFAKMLNDDRSTRNIISEDNHRVPDGREYAKNRNTELFYFDPNTASKGEWERLGVREKTIRTILNYVSKGGHFYKPEDLRKVYGLQEDLVERLIPFVKLPERRGGKFSSGRYKSTNEEFQKREQKYFPKNDHVQFERRRITVVDINRADSAELEFLPGIGPRLASRIVHFRQKLGGFYHLEQVSEVYGLADSVYKLILPMLTISETRINRININKSDVYVLKSHPYIGWQIANLLIRYRQQHGDFKSVESIREIEGISAGVAIKLLPYLSID